MEKKTIVAVVLAVAVIIGSLLVQSLFFPRETPPAAPAPTEAPQAQPPQAQAPPAQLEQAPPAAQTAPPQQEVQPAPEKALQEETIPVETQVFLARFTNRGGELVSLELKDFKNPDGSNVNMVFSQKSGISPFNIRFGDTNAPMVNALFDYERSLTGPGVTFFRTFLSPSGVPFTLRKSFIFHDDDYMIEAHVTIENSVNEYPDLDVNGFAYTFGYGPQIGPAFKELDRRNEFRNYLYYADGKSHNVKIPKEGVESLSSRVSWVALTGKYFELIAVPDATPYLITMDSRPLSGLVNHSSVYFSRPVIKSSKNTDVFRFYLGPKKRDILLSYNDPAKNAFGLADQHFEDTLSRPFFLISWLADALKFFLELFYRLIPNYGVAIILLTILIKVILFPLTHRSFESTARMQALQPKINELREKHKNNPQKLNTEIAAMYKKEGVNPMGGCLPLLLQLPVFFALYSLLNTFFPLRSAVFIPGWINDLSSPESILSLPFTIPLLRADSLRVLPFVMLVTTFLQSRLTQAPDASGANMKLMTYAMPVVFFFILYNMPSGLVLYWTVQNVLSIFQQMYTNSRRAKAPAAQRELPRGGPPRGGSSGFRGGSPRGGSRGGSPRGGRRKPPPRKRK